MAVANCQISKCKKSMHEDLAIVNCQIHEKRYSDKFERTKTFCAMKQSIKELIVEKITGEWGDESINGEGTKVIRTTNFTNLGIINYDKIVTRNIDEKKIIKKHLKKGDIIIEKSGGGPKQPVGRVVFFDLDTDEKYLCNNFTAILRPNKELINPKYLFYQLHIAHHRGRTLRHQHKTTGIINLQLDNYLKEKIEVPSLTDQIRIANILSKAETLIEQRKQSIALLDEFIQNSFWEMFGDGSKFEWKYIPEIASDEKHSLSSGPFGSNLTSQHYTNSGVIILRGTNITSGKLDLSNVKYISEEKAIELKRSEIKPNDIVIIAVGSSGKALKVPENLPRAIMSQNFNKITANQNLIVPIYLEFCINDRIVQQQFKKKITDTARTFLSLTSIKEIKIPVPPIELQTQFAQLVEKTEALKEQYKNSL
ncbi:MAG: restriction endonuclease subunit S, partial [Bacteroidia bacterium]